ncbi:MAG: TIGR04283 family arsenosugar biosynthesis glycosyltransferase [Bacteroidia bacterium]
MKISVIIPTFKEEGVGNLISFLKSNAEPGTICEIIVSDGGSPDQTAALAHNAGATVISSPEKGRAAQMNFGASHAVGDILYFLHADSYPPEGFATEMLSSVKAGFDAGSYRLRLDDDHWFLRLNCWFTRFNVNAFRFGDQSLFVTRHLFSTCNGFKNLIFMEDQEIISRLKKQGRFRVLPRAVTTSARKYRDNGIFRLQAIYFLIWFMYKAGASQQQILKRYRLLIRQDKL